MQDGVLARLAQLLLHSLRAVLLLRSRSLRAAKKLGSKRCVRVVLHDEHLLDTLDRVAVELLLSILLFPFIGFGASYWVISTLLSNRRLIDAHCVPV